MPLVVVAAVTAPGALRDFISEYGTVFGMISERNSRLSWRATAPAWEVVSEGHV